MEAIKITTRRTTSDPIQYGAYVNGVCVYLGDTTQDRRTVRALGTKAAHRAMFRCTACGCEYHQFRRTCPSCDSASRVGI